MTGPFYLADGGPSSSPTWATDGAAIVVGTLHLTAVAGFWTAVRYYAGDTGVEVTLRIWEGSSSPLTEGTPLVTLTHTAEEIGWQVVPIEPILAELGVPYVAARGHPSHFGLVSGFFSAARGAFTEADPVYAPGTDDDIAALLDAAHESGWGGQGARNGRFVEPAADLTIWPTQPGNGSYFAVDLEFRTETGPAEVTLTPAELVLSAVPVTPTPGPVTVALTPASLGLAAVPVTPAPQPVTVVLTPAVLSLSAVPLGLPGEQVTGPPDLIYRRPEPALYRRAGTLVYRRR